MHLWYNKDDYKKEREAELARLAELEKNQENAPAQPTENAEGAEPAATENQVQPVDSITQVAPAEGEPQQPQTPSENTETPATTESNPEPTETPPAPMEKPKKSAENQPQTEPEPIIWPTLPQTENNEPALMQSENPQTPEQTESQPVPTEIPAFTPIEATQPTELENKPAIVEANRPFVGSIQEKMSEATNEVPLTDSVENIEKYTDTLKTLLPTKAVICIGEYPINIILKGNLASKKEVLTIFVEKSCSDVVKWGQGKLDKNNIVCLDEDIDTHFWYDIMPYVVDNAGFLERLKTKTLENIQGAIVVSSTWNGVGGALLPTLNSQIKEWNINTVSLALLPSKAQPLDGQFNSLSSLGILASKDSTIAILIDRDNLEDFTGSDSAGFAVNGNDITNYLLDLMLSKDTFASELCEFSKSFDTKMFTVMLAPGMSLKLYGSLENMLNTTLVRPLLTFDLSTATLLYVLIRMPFNLKGKFPRGKIELAVANWFKDKADLESIFIADPVYTDDSSDRVDIAMFVGGFDLAQRFTALEKKVEKMKNRAVKKRSITEEDWQLITKSLLE